MDIRIPMPGHYVTDAEEVEKDVQQLTDVIDEHDVIFLLTDTRESRWLPTMLAAYRGKVLQMTSMLAHLAFIIIFLNTAGSERRLGLRHVFGDASRSQGTVEARPEPT